MINSNNILKVFYYFVISILFLFSCTNNSNPTSPELELLINSQLPQDQNYYSVKFVDENIGWVAGKKGVVYNTTDGGKTWENQNTLSTDDLIKINFIDKNNGIIAGTNSILTTEDGGKSWNQKLSNVSFSKFVSISTVNKNTMWVSGTADGKIFHTIDAGLNWEIQQVDTIGRVVELSFQDESNGYAFSNMTGIYKTIDEGNNWSKIATPRFCSTIYFKNSELGFSGNNIMPSSIAIDKANIYYTKDGGNNWETQIIPEATSVWKISFVNSFMGFAIVGGISSFTEEATDWVKCGKLIYTSNQGNEWDECFPEVFNDEVVDFSEFDDNKLAVLTISGEIYLLQIK